MAWVTILDYNTGKVIIREYEDVHDMDEILGAEFGSNIEFMTTDTLNLSINDG